MILRVIKGPRTGARLAISSLREMFIGNGADADLDLGDPDVGPQHVAVGSDESGGWVVDPIGPNVQRNGHLIEERGPLQPGDILRIGNHVLACCDPRLEIYPRLLGLGGPVIGMAYVLRRREVIIGRSSKDATLTVPDQRASRRHCALRYRDGRWHADDLQSANGTRHNGHQLYHETALGEGDMLTLGTCRFVFLPGSRSIEEIEAEAAGEAAGAGAAGVGDDADTLRYAHKQQETFRDDEEWDGPSASERLRVREREWNRVGMLVAVAIMLVVLIVAAILFTR
ncbi:MAG: FHA domain-containing protein [Planctomycetota bacterium]